MATKLYLPSSGTPALSSTPPASGSWNNSSPWEVFTAVTTKISSSMVGKTVAGDATGSVMRYQGRVQYVYGPLIGGTPVTGYVDAQCRCNESSTSLNGTWAMTIRVMYQDGGTWYTRGTPLALTAATPTGTPPEFATSATNRRFRNVSNQVTPTLTNVTPTTGDYLVIDMGISEVNTSTSRTGTLTVGDDSGTDLGSNDTDTSAYNPWINFSNTLPPLFTVTPLSGRITGSRNLLPLNVANGCESGSTPGWTEVDNSGNLTVAVDASSPYSGSYCIKLTDTGNPAVYDYVETANTPISASTPYVVSARVKTGGSGQGLLGIQWYDNTQTYIDNNHVTFSNTDYQKVMYSASMPSNAAYAHIYFTADLASGTRSFFGDEFQFECGSTPTVYDPPKSAGLNVNMTGAATVYKGISGRIGGAYNILAPNQADAGDTLGNTNGFAGNVGASVSLDTVNYYQGAKSIKVTTANSDYTGCYTTPVAITGGGYFTGRVRVKAPSGSGTMYVQLIGNSTGQVNFKEFAPTGDWQEVELDTLGEYVQTTGSDTDIKMNINYYLAPGVINFNVDEIQIEPGQTVHDWTHPSNTGIKFGLTGALSTPVVTATPLGTGTITTTYTTGTPAILVNRKVTGTIGSNFGCSATGLKYAPAKVTGTIPATSGAQATGLKYSPGRLSGSVASQVTVQNPVALVSKKVTGSVSSSFTTTGSIKVTKNVTGTINGASTVSATGLKYSPGRVSGTIPVSTTLPNPGVLINRRISGQLGPVSISVLNSPIQLSMKATGSIGASFGCSATTLINAGTTKDVTGTITTAFTVNNPVALVTKKVTGTIPTTFTVQNSTIKVDRKVTGSIGIQTTIPNSQVKVTRLITGHINTAFTAGSTGLRYSPGRISGGVALQTGVSATGLRYNPGRMAGSIPATFNIPNATLSLYGTISCTGSIGAQFSTLNAPLLATKRITGSIPAAFTVNQASLLKTVKVTGTVATVFTSNTPTLLVIKTITGAIGFNVTVPSTYLSYLLGRLSGSVAITITVAGSLVPPALYMEARVTPRSPIVKIRNQNPGLEILGREGTASFHPPNWDGN